MAGHRGSLGSTLESCCLSRNMAQKITFESTSDPSKIASVTLPEADEYDTRENCDPDKLLQCPFDKNHRIRSSRFPYHIIKCRKNHPKLANELESCPFNARHLVPKRVLQSHIETCSDRTLVDSGEEASGFYKWKLPVSTWENPNPTEDWDKEADDYAPPFMLARKMESNKKATSTSETAAFQLDPAFKKPNTLPWSDF